jgi:hypothetical protein
MDAADWRHVKATEKVVHMNDGRNDVVGQPIPVGLQHRHTDIQVMVVDPQQ